MSHEQLKRYLDHLRAQLREIALHLGRHDVAQALDDGPGEPPPSGPGEGDGGHP